jgi:hypothetical protein
MARSAGVCPAGPRGAAHDVHLLLLWPRLLMEHFLHADQQEARTRPGNTDAYL